MTGTFRHRQSGNAFMMVLIGVVLFGALAFTFMRSGRQGISNISTKQATVAAGNVLSYAQNIEKGISRLRTKGISENNIDFVGADPAYNNLSCSIDKCQVFMRDGGQQQWQPTPGNANDGTPWAFTGALRVGGIGQDAANAASSDLLMVLPNVDVTVCREINRRLDIENPGENPPVAGSAGSFNTRFIGTFTAGGSLSGAAFDGKFAACYATGATYHFYQVLLAR